jgi:hypothetical protein
MKFSAFTRSEIGNVILLKNLSAIENIKTVKYFKDDAAGSFTKIEVRWSFNNEYWASWTNLTQGAISDIVVSGKYIWFEIRYTQSSVGSGNVTTFSIDYTEVPIGQQSPPLPVEEDIVIESATFARVATDTVITFKNTAPFIRVNDITGFEDDSAGTFLSKQFRWSFNNSYWSAWETLTTEKLALLQAYPNTNLYLEVKYTLSAAGLGTVTEFNISYTQFAEIVGTIDEETTETITEEPDVYTGYTSSPTFSNFKRSTSGLEILFANLVPVTYVDNITEYNSDSVGLFSKEEFRWSFNNNYWSAWTTLSEDNLNRIVVYPNKYLYLEIRFVQSSVDTGTATTFSINYKKLTSDQYPVDSGPDIAIPESGATCSTVVKTRIETTHVDDADKLCGQPCEFYLWRPNHKGTQPITSIEGLQTTLNNYSAALLSIDASLSIVMSDYLTDASLSSDFYWYQGTLRVDVSVAGVNKLYVDVSLLARDASITYNLNQINQLDASIIRIDASIIEIWTQFNYVDTSLNSIWSQINDIDSSISDIYNSGVFLKEASLGTSFYWDSGFLEASGTGGGVSQEYVDGSLNNIRATYIPDASLSSDFYWSSNLLKVNASTAGSVVSPDLDYKTYTPFTGDITFSYTGDLVNRIYTVNSIGIKDVSFLYNANDDVSTVTIKKYDASTRVVTFEKDVNDNIIAVHIV